MLFELLRIRRVTVRAPFAFMTATPVSPPRSETGFARNLTLLGAPSDFSISRGLPERIRRGIGCQMIGMKTKIAINAARCIVWAYFLLIPTKLVEFFAMHGGSIRPFHVYALIIAAGALTVARHVRLSDVSLPERSFIALCALLIGWMFVSPGGRLNFEYNLVLWPLANLAMGVILFGYARRLGLGSTIIAAATGALILELAGIFADMWFPGLLAEWPARPAGFAQNSNNGALVVVMLLAMLLPLRLRDAPSRSLTCAMIASAPLVFVTLSKSGWSMYAMVAFIYAGTLYFAPVIPRPGKRFMAGFAAVFLLTISLAPVLHEPWAISVWRSRVGISVPDILPGFISRLHAEPLSQQQMDEFIKASDTTTESRMESAKFFFRIGMERPLFGHGTGFIYRYEVGPHNQFISLIAEQGCPAAVLYCIALVILFGLAIQRMSPSLFAIVAIGSFNSLVSHTVLIEPVLIVLAISMLGLRAQHRPHGRDRRTQAADG